MEITPETIYDYVDASGQLPRTSAVNVFDYVREFRSWRQQGYSVVHFCISSDFSSSYQNACMAAADVGDVYVVDSRNLSTGQGLLVLHGAELAAAGHTAEEIQRACTDLAPRVEASFVIDRLDYLYKGGRCSALSAFGGNLLKLKPCIEVKDGKMTPGKKYRGPIDKVMLQYTQDRLQGRMISTGTGCSLPIPAAPRRRWRRCGRSSWSCVPILRRSSRPPQGPPSPHTAAPAPWGCCSSAANKDLCKHPGALLRGVWQLVKKGRIASAFGKEDSYERNPSGVSFVFNHRIFRTFMKVLKMLLSLSKKGHCPFWTSSIP